MLFLSACAVLQVDVDVYKGPLASHDKVIAQRVSASAIGIQADLIRLRENLSDKTTQQLSADCRDRVEGKLVGGKLSRQERLACEVDAILQLYEDKSDPRLASISAEAEQAFQKARQAVLRLDRKVAFGNVRERERYYADLLWDIHKNNRNTDQRSDLAKALSCFLDNEGHEKECAYATLSDGKPPAFRLWEPIVWETAKLAANDPDMRSVTNRRAFTEVGSSVVLQFEKLGDAHANGLEGDVTGNPDVAQLRGYKSDIGDNEGFEAIADRALMNALADHALGKSSNDNETYELAGLLFESANSFNSARDGYARSLILGLEAIETIYADDFMDGFDSDQRRAYQRLADELAEAIVRGIDIRNLERARKILPKRESDSMVDWVMDDASVRIGSTCEGASDRGSNSRELLRSLRERLLWALKEEPQRTASELLELNDNYKSASDQVAKAAGLDCRHQSPASRRYGLVGGPNTDDASATFTEDLLSANVNWSGVSLFRRGRTNDGLWTLIENYVEATNELAEVEARLQSRCISDENCAVRTRQREAGMRLNDALVRFADHILALANSSHEYDYLDPEKDRNGDKKNTKLYAIVLQRIGNSILAISDELEAKRSYDTQQALTSDREYAAIQQSFSADPGSYYARFRASVADRQRQLQVQFESASTDISAVTDERTKLTRELQELKGECKSEQDRLKTALGQVDGPGIVHAGDFCGDTTPSEPISSVFKIERKLPALWVPIYKTSEEALSANAGSGLRTIALTATFSGDKGSRAAGLYDDVFKKIAGATAPQDAVAAELHKAQAQSLADLGADTTFKSAVLKRLSNIDLPNSPAAVAYIIDSGIVAELTARQAAYPRIADAQKALQSKVGALTEKRAALKKNTGLSETMTKTEQEGRARLEIAQKALNIVDKERQYVLDKLGSDDVGAMRPGTVTRVLLDHIKNLKPPDPENSAIVQFLSEIPTPLSGAPILAASGSAPATSKEALDQLIAALRIEQIRILSENEESSQPARFVQNARDAADRQRSDQIYIRPAISYLRTSFASNALGDNAVRWRNLLDNQVKRTVPVLGELFENKIFDGFPLGGDMEHQRAILAIREGNDTQFWQNVNRVRVSGGGNANYVVTKDDIGNWYVRRYSSSSDRIFESMQNLAIYSAGAPASALGKPTSGDDGDAETALVVSPLEKVLKDRAEAYRSATSRQYDELQKKLAASGSDNAISASVLKAWSEDELLSKPRKTDDESSKPFEAIKDLPTAYVEQMNEVAGKMATLVKNAEKRAEDDKLEKEAKAEFLAQEQSRAIQSALLGIKSYYDFVNAQLESETFVEADEASAALGDPKPRAQSLLAMKIKTEMDDQIRRRRDDIEAYRNTAAILAESVSAE